MHEYGMQVIDALAINFDEFHAADSINRLEIYLRRSHDCSHQMIDTMTHFAERADPVSSIKTLLQERSLDFFKLIRDYSRPCYVTGNEDESLDGLINTAERILKLPHNTQIL